MKKYKKKENFLLKIKTIQSWSLVVIILDALIMKCLPVEVKLMSSSKDNGTVGSESDLSDGLEIDALF